MTSRIEENEVPVGCRWWIRSNSTEGDCSFLGLVEISDLEVSAPALAPTPAAMLAARSPRRASRQATACGPP